MGLSGSTTKGCPVLADLGIDLDAVRGSMERIIGRGQPVSGVIGLTPRAKQVIELAVEEARRLKHHYVGTEHLLLGLLAGTTQPASGCSSASVRLAKRCARRLSAA